MTCLLGSALVAILLAGSASSTDDAQQDLEKFQGEWRLVSLLIDGRSLPGDSKSINKVIIAGNKLSITLKSPEGEKEEKHSMTFVLLPDRTPKGIDFAAEDGPDKGKTIPGIYELKGDALKFCAADPPRSTERPKEFTSKEGSGHVLWELQRLKK